ncbi:hypothetical protein COJ46_06235 [Bacillus sp. AFS077874]|nr:hypothetical protein COJ46_06235 [Bacillus sp. AFS077874]
MEAGWSAPTSIIQSPRKVAFYFYWTLAYDLEGLPAGTRHHENVEASWSAPTSIRLRTRKVLFTFIGIRLMTSRGYSLELDITKMWRRVGQPRQA